MVRQTVQLWAKSKALVSDPLFSLSLALSMGRSTALLSDLLLYSGLPWHTLRGHPPLGHTRGGCIVCASRALCLEALMAFRLAWPLAWL
jgi:hypothetical protein